MPLNKLPQLAWFTLIAEHGSLTKAAAVLGVSRAALSQSLKALETQLNVKLIYRTTRNMSLSEEGRQLYELLSPAFSSIKQAVRSVHDPMSTPTGTLRLTASRTAAKYLLEPHLEEFFFRHPALKIELMLDEGMPNIVADGCDAGIRLGNSLPPHMIAVPVSPILEMTVVASPRYLQQKGIPIDPTDLKNHSCVAYRHTPTGIILDWKFSDPCNPDRAISIEPSGPLISNDDESLTRAALSGIGLIQHLNLAVSDELQKGTLVKVLERWTQPFPGFYLYTPSRDKMPSKVRALMDFLIEKREFIPQIQSVQ